jgi:hypothetical protein
MMRHSETMPAASRLLLSHPIVCLLAVMAAVVVLEVIGPLDVVRAADIAVEGESLNRPASGTSLITGAGYSGGTAPLPDAPLPRPRLPRRRCRSGKPARSGTAW